MLASRLICPVVAVTPSSILSSAAVEVISAPPCKRVLPDAAPTFAVDTTKADKVPLPS